MHHSCLHHPCMHQHLLAPPLHAPTFACTNICMHQQLHVQHLHVSTLGHTTFAYTTLACKAVLLQRFSHTRVNVLLRVCHKSRLHCTWPWRWWMSNRHTAGSKHCMVAITHTEPGQMSCFPAELRSTRLMAWRRLASTQHTCQANSRIYSAASACTQGMPDRETDKEVNEEDMCMQEM